MTRFRMISRCGEGLALLRRIQSEGYDCDFWVRPGIARELYAGLIPRVDIWRDGLDHETVVLFDSPGSGKTVAEIPRSWGAGALNDVLQFDRGFGMGIARIHGLNVPKEEDQGPDQTDDSLTLQAWYVRGELVPGSLFSTIEQNHFLAGNYGPRCQPPLCLGWFWRPKKKRDGEKSPTLYRQTLKRLEPFLLEQKYSGPLCLKLRMEKQSGKPVLLAVETGLRYPAIYAMLEGLQGSIGEVLASLSQGEMPRLQASFDWLGVLALSVPPYPCYAGYANVGVGGDLLENPHVWPLDVKQVAGENFTAGAHGIVAHVTARSAQREALNPALYGLSERIQIADKQVRNDGVDGDDVFGVLRTWHYF